jgi:hypothetical protein
MFAWHLLGSTVCCTTSGGYSLPSEVASTPLVSMVLGFTLWDILSSPLLYMAFSKEPDRGSWVYFSVCLLIKGLWEFTVLCFEQLKPLSQCVSHRKPYRLLCIWFTFYPLEKRETHNSFPDKLFSVALICALLDVSGFWGTALWSLFV